MERCEICGRDYLKKTTGGYKCRNCSAEYVCTHAGIKLLDRSRTEMITFSKTGLKRHDAKIRAEAKAEALKEAAERYRKEFCPLLSNGRTVKPDSCEKCTKMLGTEYCSEVEAIMGITGEPPAEASK